MKMAGSSSLDSLMMSFNAQIELIKTLDAAEIQQSRTYTYNFRQVRATVALQRMELMSVARGMNRKTGEMGGWDISMNECNEIEILVASIAAIWLI